VITPTLSEAILAADAAFFQALIDRDVLALDLLLGEQFVIVDVATGGGGIWRLISAQETPIPGTPSL
jgi:hypothetical protein